MITEIQNENEFYRCINDRRYKATIVKFYTNWCPPCKSIKQFFEELSFQYSDLQFLAVDIDSFRILAGYNGVHAMPTFCFYKDGTKTSDNILGAKRDELARVIHFYSMQPANEYPTFRGESNFDSSNDYFTYRNNSNLNSSNDYFSSEITDYEYHKPEKDFLKKYVLF